MSLFLPHQALNRVVSVGMKLLSLLLLPARDTPPRAMTGFTFGSVSAG